MGICSTRAILPNNCLCVFLYPGINVGWCTVHAWEQLLQGNWSRSELPPWWFVLLHLKIPLLLSRCKQGKILCCFRYQDCFFNRKHCKGWTWCYSIKKSFQILLNLSPLDLYTELICLPVGMNLGILGKMHNFCTSCFKIPKELGTFHPTCSLLLNRGRT